MRRNWLTSDRGRLALSFLVFAVTAFILLAAPLDRPLAVHGAGHGSALGAAGVVQPLLSWLACLGGLLLQWRLIRCRSNNLRFVFTHYLLFVFLLFFAAERLTGSAAEWMRGTRPGHAMPWLEVLASVGIAVGAAFVLPLLRSVREGSAIVQQEHARFLAAAESTLDDFYIFDGVPDETGKIVDFRFSYINPNAERRLNVPRESLVGKILTEVRPFMKTSGLIEKYREVVRTGVPFTTEVFLDDEMIKATWLNVQVVKLGDGIAITSRDVTERRRLTDRIHYLAHHDQLTGLANRTLLQDRLQQAILRAQRGHHKVALFVLDIDRFKQINDSLGHADGDALLAGFGQRLLATVRETDTVARIGGDEFVIVMPEFRNAEDVRHAAATLVQAASQPLTIGSREISITVSAGVCLYPDGGLDPEELLRKADAAMYSIKDSGRNGLQFCEECALNEAGDLLATGD